MLILCLLVLVALQWLCIGYDRGSRAGRDYYRNGMVMEVITAAAGTSSYIGICSPCTRNAVECLFRK